MTTHSLSTIKQFAEEDSKNGYVVHINVIRRAAGDYVYQTSDWCDSSSIAGYENGRLLYDYSNGTGYEAYLKGFK